MVMAAFFALAVALGTLDVRAKALEELRRIKSPQPQPVLVSAIDADAPDPIIPDRSELVIIRAPEPLVPEPAIDPAWPEPVDWSVYDRPAYIRWR
jgi:hypothetical protein